MNRRRWWRLLVLFVVAVGIAIISANLLASQANLSYDAVYQSSHSSSTQASAVAFPSDYQQRFVHYASVDCPNSRIVRKMYVNREALNAIATQSTIPSGTVIVMETHSAESDQDGRLVPTQVNNVFIREKRSGWNIDSDSGEWQSAWYSPSGSLVSDNQSSCIGCHTRVRDRDYLFTLPALLTAAQTGQLQQQHTEFGTSVCR